MLQQNLFSRIDLGFDGRDVDRRQIQWDFVKYGPFDEPGEQLIARYRALADRAAENGRTLVISHERLSGYPASGNFDARLVADRIKTIFPEARILMLTREQRSMIYSFYLQYISDGGSLSFARLTTPNDINLFRKTEFSLKSFQYHHWAEYYAKLFGPENVLVIPFELLKRQSGAVAREIAEFAGQGERGNLDEILAKPRNQGLPITMQLVRRRLNTVIGRSQLSPHAPFRVARLSNAYRRLAPLFRPFRFLEGPLRRDLERAIEKLARGHFEASNRRLQALTRHDLAQYGYSMASEDASPLQSPRDAPPVDVPAPKRSRGIRLASAAMRP